MRKVSELNELLDAFGESGADRKVFENNDIAYLAVRVDCKRHG